MTTKNETAKAIIKAEVKRRFDFINDKEFIKMCAENAERIGITAKEWNDNKAGILLMFANEFCHIENNIK